MVPEAVNQFESTMNHLQRVLSSYSNEQLNTVPFENSWTAAQVADHVIRSQAGTPELFQGNTIPAGRQPDEKKEAIKKVFLDYSIKMKSPEFILPSDEVQDKETLISTLSDKRTKILDAFQSLNPADICLDFEIPGFGGFTRLEWVYFLTYHTQRHVRQLENIYQKITDS